MERTLDFDPFCEGFIWEKYPKLAARDVFSKLPEEYLDLGEIRGASMLSELTYENLDKLIRFVIIFVDQSSPIGQEVDFELRRKKAAEMLGHLEKEPYFYFVEENHPFFNLLMYEYFKMMNSILYEVWFSAKMSLHFMNLQLRSSFSMKDSDRVKYMQNINELAAVVAKQEISLFGDDELTKKLVSAGATASIALGGYAEKYALILTL